MRNAAFALVLTGVLLSGQPKQATQTFNGVITDSMCARGNHSSMKMGADDRECAIACVHAHGSDYVLFDGQKVYVLSDQAKGEEFAGRKVAVTGTASGEVLRVQSIRAAR